MTGGTASRTSVRRRAGPPPRSGPCGSRYALSRRMSADRPPLHWHRHLEFTPEQDDCAPKSWFLAVSVTRRRDADASASVVELGASMAVGACDRLGRVVAAGEPVQPKTERALSRSGPQAVQAGSCLVARRAITGLISRYRLSRGYGSRRPSSADGWSGDRLAAAGRVVHAGGSLVEQLHALLLVVCGCCR